MIKVLSIFGTRPEAIKMAPVIQELQKHSAEIESTVCVTAQHREMLDQVLDVFELSPDLDLDLMKPDQSLTGLTARALTGVSAVMNDLKPDVVLVQGDTTTVMASALAAFYQHIAVGHVEAGLRSHHRYLPFPEEINRKLTDVMTTYYFAPTQTAADALLQEGVSEKDIHVTGNTVIDALLWIQKHPRPQEVVDIRKAVGEKRIILLTAHRRESFGDPFQNICHAVQDIVRKNDDVAVVYPVHLNPQVQKPVINQLGDEERVYLIDPLSYLSFVHLMNEAEIILTDSGGIQEEAPALGKPVLVLRDVTERPEAVEAGTAKLVGTDREKIFWETQQLLENDQIYNQMANAISPYGDGHAAERIVRILLKDHVMPIT